MELVTLYHCLWWMLFFQFCAKQLRLLFPNRFCNRYSEFIELLCLQLSCGVIFWKKSFLNWLLVHISCLFLEGKEKWSIKVFNNVFLTFCHWSNENGWWAQGHPACWIASNPILSSPPPMSSPGSLPGSSLKQAPFKQPMGWCGCKEYVCVYTAIGHCDVRGRNPKEASSSIIKALGFESLSSALYTIRSLTHQSQALRMEMNWPMKWQCGWKREIVSASERWAGF